MLARLLGLALALALSGAAMAAPRPVQVGDVYRYASDTEQVITGALPYRQTNRFVYDLEVLDVRPDGLTMRFTVREVRAEDDRGEGIEAVGQAYIGLPVEFETDQDLKPVRLLDWPGFKAAYLDRLDPALRDGVAASLAGLENDPQGLAEQYSGDMLTFAPFLKLDGRTDGCRAQTSRSDSSVRFGTGAGRFKTKARAVVSGDDGWVLEADETRSDEKPDGTTETLTVKVRRVSPQPFC
jgi:hypothetical protein